MELDEREAHCLARLIQGALHGDSIFDCCAFCRYPCYDLARDKMYSSWFYKEIFYKLEAATGVSLGALVSEKDDGEFESPFDRFLINANPKARAFVEHYLKDVADGKCAAHGEFDSNYKWKGYPLKLTFTMTDGNDTEKLNALIRHVKKEFGKVFVHAEFNTLTEDD